MNLQHARIDQLCQQLKLERIAASGAHPEPASGRS
jgi:hypothetical protein